MQSVFKRRTVRFVTALASVLYLPQHAGLQCHGEGTACIFEVMLR